MNHGASNENNYSRQTMTPGPWEVESGMVQTAYDHDCNTPGCGVKIPIALMHRESRNGTMPCERDANAKAISAVPDLIAANKLALEAILYILTDCAEDDRARLEPVSDSLHASLAKAGV